MKYDIDLAIPIKNREAWRIGKLVSSLRAHGADPRIWIVDYGSDDVFSAQYQEMAISLGTEYEKLFTEGWPWNKCRAINRAARLAEGELFCTADVDVIFTSDPIGYCLGMETHRRMFHVPSYWMRKKGGIDSAFCAGEGTPGMFQLLEKSAFAESGGYDERIVYWGMEDLDWPARLIALGYEQVWLPEPHRIYHQWHPRSEKGHLRPETASFDTMRACAENRLKPVLAQDWGKPVRESDRPILSLFKSSSPKEIKLATNALMHYGNLDLLLGAKGKGAFVKLVLGERLVRRPLSKFAGSAMTILRPTTALTGLSCVEKKNSNFDYFYAMLPGLVDNGIVDYFFTNDLTEAYLLWD